MAKSNWRNEELKELSIPVDKLSKLDQDFIKSFQKKAGLAAVPVPRLPEVESFSHTKPVNIVGKGRRWGNQDNANTDSSHLNLALIRCAKGST